MHRAFAGCTIGLRLQKAAIYVVKRRGTTSSWIRIDIKETRRKSLLIQVIYLNLQKLKLVLTIFFHRHQLFCAFSRTDNRVHTKLMLSLVQKFFIHELTIFLPFGLKKITHVGTQEKPFQATASISKNSSERHSGNRK